MDIVVVRGASIKIPGKESFTPGEVYVSGAWYCYSCEDEDRHLEDNPRGKVYGKTAIPRGRYKLEIYNSPKRGPVIQLIGVPGYSNVQFHGANRAEDLLGCIGLGRVKTSTGIAQCKDTVKGLFDRVKAQIDKKNDCYVEVK